MENTAYKKIPIIALDHTSWEGVWMNRQHILSRLGERGWPIIYSNGAKFYNEISITKPFGSTKKQNYVTIYNAGFLLPRNYKFTELDRLAIRKHCADLKKAANIKKGDDFIAFCFHPDFYPYIAELNAPYIMFHIYDVFQNFSTQKSENTNVQELINTASLITASSEITWEETVQDKSLSPNIIHNGVDFASFKKKKAHNSKICNLIAKLPSPKVCYLGAINKKLDYGLLNKLAERFPDMSFIMVGPRMENSIKESKKLWRDYQAFSARANVHYTGAITKEEIPACLDLMDATIAPYITDRSTWAFAGFPLKINEYLAAGKPVISSATETIIQHFSEIITISNTFEEWAQALIYISSGRDTEEIQERRIAFAKKNDWNNRVDQLEKLMSEMIRT